MKFYIDQQYDIDIASFTVKKNRIGAREPSIFRQLL